MENDTGYRKRIINGGNEMEFKDIIYEKKDGIAKITLNRPQSYNAFSVDMLEGWYRALLNARDDEEVRVVILTGAGKAFCSGGDVKSMQAGKGFCHGYARERGETISPREYKESLEKLVHRIPLALRDLDKPVIASVNGPAMGAGLDMALMCDIRIASDRAVFAESYINVGLVPGDGGAFFLPRLVGVAKALELLLTGERIDAAEALRIGLVNRVVPEKELEKESWELASTIAQKSPRVARLIKRLVYEGLSSDVKTALDTVSSHMAVIAVSDDHRKALEAFLKKRS